MRRVYVDTSALLPLLDRGDADHGPVREAVCALAEEGAALVTTSYVLVEAGALVRRRLGAEVFSALGEVVRRSLDVIWVDEGLHLRAWAAAEGGGRRGPSLVDWVGFLAIEEEGIEAALAVDAHFAGRGVTVMP